MRCTDNRRRIARVRSERPSGYTQREWRRINEQEERESRKNRRLLLLTVLLFLVAVMMAYFVWYAVFRSHDRELSLPFDSTSAVYGFSQGSTAGTASSFAADLCVADGDVNPSLLSVTAHGAGLFDLTKKEVLYGKDMFTQRSEASLTKIMTALVALKYGNLEDVVTVTDTALDIEEGSSVCNIRPGDRLSLKQLLYGLLIASGNDAAMMIAEHVGGSVDQFVVMMNQEAAQLGATHTAFANPSGLTQEGHYTCVYDLYLMFNAAMQYDTFMDIINRTNYYAEYTGADGEKTAVTWESTNYYFTGEAVAPDNVIVYGGKTGTTDDAGPCLCLLAKDAYGNPYVAIILHAEDKEKLYEDMNAILGQANNSD